MIEVSRSNVVKREWNGKGKEDMVSGVSGWCLRINDMVKVGIFECGKLKKKCIGCMWNGEAM